MEFDALSFHLVSYVSCSFSSWCTYKDSLSWSKQRGCLQYKASIFSSQQKRNRYISQLWVHERTKLHKDRSFCYKSSQRGWLHENVMLGIKQQMFVNVFESQETINSMLLICCKDYTQIAINDRGRYTFIEIPLRRLRNGFRSLRIKQNLHSTLETSLSCFMKFQLRRHQYSDSSIQIHNHKCASDDFITIFLSSLPLQ